MAEYTNHYHDNCDERSISLTIVLSSVSYTVIIRL